MKYQKSLSNLVLLVVIFLITWIILSSPENSLPLLLIISYSLLAYFRPTYAISLLILIPVTGEFSRLDFFGRSIVLSDLAVPIFTLSTIIPRFKKLQDLVQSHPQLKVISKILFAFFLIAILSLFFSLASVPFREVINGSQYLFRLFFYLLLIPAVILLQKESPSFGKLIPKVIIASGLLIALGGFLQLIYFPSLESFESIGYDPHINRLFGTWLDPNYIGGLFALLSCFCLGLLLQIKKSTQRLILLCCVGIFATALFFTYSRSAYLALAVGIFIIGILRARTILIITIILALIGISASDRAQQRVGELITSINSIVFNTSENPDPTARLRILNWEQTVELIKQKPFFGHGFNNLAFVRAQAGYIQSETIHSASGSDSSILTLLATTGVIGTAPFLLFLLYTIFQSKKYFNSKKHTIQSALALGCLSGLLAIIAHSNFVNSLFFAPLMIFLWIIVGYFYSTIESPSN